MAELPQRKTLALSQQGGTLHVTLSRPEVRNAMSLEMVRELQETLDLAERDERVRTLVLRGAGGHFCAGGDIKDMAAARSAPPEGEADPGPRAPAGHSGVKLRDPLAATNRAFGAMITRFDRSPLATVAVLEGAVMGGGFGLACVVDVAIARVDARFRLPETGLGIPPAQIAPFLVRRLGLSQARRLAVTGADLDGRAAQAIGLVHLVCEEAELETRLDELLAKIDRCAPGAIAVTKELMLQAGALEHEALLDHAAAQFARAARGPEGVEGMTAFIQKRRPRWSGEGGQR